jgi:hypothetical protein
MPDAERKAESRSARRADLNLCPTVSWTCLDKPGVNGRGHMSSGPGGGSSEVVFMDAGSKVASFQVAATRLTA